MKNAENAQGSQLPVSPAEAERVSVLYYRDSVPVRGNLDDPRKRIQVIQLIQEPQRVPAETARLTLHGSLYRPTLREPGRIEETQAFAARELPGSWP